VNFIINGGWNSSFRHPTFVRPFLISFYSINDLTNPEGKCLLTFSSSQLVTTTCLLLIIMSRHSVLLHRSSTYNNVFWKYILGTQYQLFIQTTCIMYMSCHCYTMRIFCQHHDASTYMLPVYIYIVSSILVYSLHSCIINHVSRYQ
jgi:hypothetical protein